MPTDDGRPWWRLPDHLDIEVTRGRVPTNLPGADSPYPWVDLLPGQALMRFGDGLSLHVLNGRSVVVDLGDSDAEADASWVLHGWAVTLVTLQRGGLSLHAGTADIGGLVVAVAGHRGAGKSTTLMALQRAGHSLLVDDVALVGVDDDRAWTAPFRRNVHLLPDAAAAVGLDFDALPRLAGRPDKVAFLPEHPPDARRDLDRVVVLTPDDDVTEAELSEVRGRERIIVLARQASRDGIAPRVLGPARFFSLVADLAARVRVLELRRPREAWTLDTVVSLIESS